MNKLFLPIAIAALIVAGLFLLIRYAPQDHQQMQGSTTTDKIFTLQLKDYHNNLVSLAELKDKPLVINSWAAWCPFCRKELVDFAAAQKEFGETVKIVAINRSESFQTAKSYSDELGVTNDLVFLLDESDLFYSAIGGFSMPETIFVAKNGVISFHKRGSMDLNEIREKIQQLISQ